MTSFSDTPEDRPDSWAVAEWRPAPDQTINTDYEFRLILSDVLRNCRTDARYDLHRRHRARLKAIQALHRRRTWRLRGWIALAVAAGLAPLAWTLIRWAMG